MRDLAFCIGEHIGSYGFENMSVVYHKKCHNSFFCPEKSLIAYNRGVSKEMFEAQRLLFCSSLWMFASLFFVGLSLFFHEILANTE